MKLNTIKDCDGARQNFKRVGRGIGSGKGKTCGRGMKGQKSRSGVAIKGFEGGQMPIYRRLPKRGFKMHNRTHYCELTIARLSRMAEAGRLDKMMDEVNAENLLKHGLIKHAYDGLKIIGIGEINHKLNLTVTKITAGAKTAIEKAGGKVSIAVHDKNKRHKNTDKESVAEPS
ncbi:MAG: 50S ribosomal protein L15 [Pseudomonadota bacterium]